MTTSQVATQSAMQEETRLVRRNAFANFAGSAWAALMAIAFIPVYIRVLGIEAYAVIALLPILHAWLTIIDAAIGPPLSREFARYRAGLCDGTSVAALLRGVELVWGVIAIALVTALLLADHAISTLWLNAQALAPGLIARSIDFISALVVLRLLEGTYHGALIGLQQLVWVNGWTAGLATLRHAGSAVIVVAVSPTIDAYFLWHIAISLVSVATFAVRVHRSIDGGALRPHESLQRIREVWRFAAGTSLVVILAIALSQVDKLLLSRLLSLEKFGYYMLASSVASALYLAVAPLAQAVYPRMVELGARNRSDELSVLYHASTQLVTIGAGSAALVLFWFGGAVIYAWSGDRSVASEVSAILAPAALGTFLHGLTNIPYQLQLAHGWIRLAVRANVIGAALYLPLLTWVVPRYGGVGAAWLWVLLNGGMAIFVTFAMHRRLLHGQYRRWLLSDVLLPTSAAAAVVTTVFLATQGLDMSRLLSAVVVGTAGVLAVSAAAASAPLARHQWMWAWKQMK